MILREAAGRRKAADLVFPSARGKVLSDATMSKLLRERGIDAVPHGASRVRSFQCVDEYADPRTGDGMSQSAHTCRTSPESTVLS